MARRPRVFAPGLLYHVIVRGNQRRKTFRGDDDYKAYLDRLEHYVRIYAYCLMPNHFLCGAPHKTWLFIKQ
jgi:putative transposase